MPSRFNNIYDNQYVSTYVPLPFQEIVAAGAAKQRVQDAASAEKMDILGKTWNRLPGDMGDSKELKQKIDSKLQEFSGKDFNDPKVKADWYKTKRDLVNEFGPNGLAGAQEANYNSYKAYEKELLSKSKELGWSADELQSHLNEAKSTFRTKQDDGNFANFQGKGVANYVDPNKWISDVMKDVAADTGISQLRKYGSLNEITDAFVHGEIEHKDYNKIMNSLALRAQGDIKLRSSLEQEGMFKGQKGWSNFMKGADKEGNVILNTDTPFGRALAGAASGAQYQKQKQMYMQVQDPLELYRAKKKADQEDMQKQMQFSIQGIPVDPNNPTNNDAGMNTAMNTDTNPLGKYWEFKDGKLTTRSDAGNGTTQVVNINGKEYNVNALPDGYKVTGASFATPGGVTSSGGYTALVVGSGGKSYGIENKKFTGDDQFEAFKELSRTAARLGVKGDRDTVTKAVEDYYKTANNFQMNFPKYDEGTIGAISKAFGVTMKNVGGELLIANPGQLAFSTIKTLDGKPLQEEDLNVGNANRLSGARLLGPAQSLTNKNYEPGDMYMQSSDGKVYIINTNNQTINKALEPTTRLTQSVNDYVTTGKKSVDPKDVKYLKDNFEGDKIFGPIIGSVVGSVVDDHGNYYYSCVNTINNKVSMNVIKVNKDGTPSRMGLDEATKQISETNMKEIIPTYNVKNFDRVAKANELDTEDNSPVIEEQ